MFVFDLEGTLSDCRHRNHLLPTEEQRKEAWKDGKKKKDLYLPFHDEFKNDPAIVPMVDLLARLYRHSRVIILTGMMEKHRNNAIHWLNRNSIRVDALIMRADDDYSPSEVYKLRYIKSQEHEVDMLFDDRIKIVDHMNKNGIPSLLVNL